MEQTYLSLCTRRTLLIHNGSDVMAHFQWKASAHQEDGQQKQRLVGKLHCRKIPAQGWHSGVASRALGALQWLRPVKPPQHPGFQADWSSALPFPAASPPAEDGVWGSKCRACISSESKLPLWEPLSTKVQRSVGSRGSMMLRPGSVLGCTEEQP